MASSSGSGTSSGGSSSMTAVAQEEVMDQRKRKRMLSNRESARRSRQRKQKHLDELTAQVTQLRTENEQILTALHVTSQHYAGVQANNSVLRTQMMELSSRLQSLNEILSYMNVIGGEGSSGGFCDDSAMRPWSFMASSSFSVDMFQYCQ